MACFGRRLAAVWRHYRRWTPQERPPFPGDDRLPGFVRRWLGHLLVNLVLLTGVLAATRSLAGEAASWWTEVTYWPEGAAAVLWLAAALWSLPLLIAVVRKLKAAAVLFAEVRVYDPEARAETPAVRAAVAGRFLLAGFFLLTSWGCLLGFWLGPSWPVLLSLLAALAAVAVALGRFWVNFYRTAHAFLEDGDESSAAH